jgi:hypothetical protein
MLAQTQEVAVAPDVAALWVTLAVTVVAAFLTAAFANPPGSTRKKLLNFAYGFLVIGVVVAVVGSVAGHSRDPDPSPDPRPTISPTGGLQPTESAEPTTSGSAAEIERVAYARKLTPICQAWKDEAEAAVQGVVPNPSAAQRISFYRDLSSILSHGSRQMQAVPQPRADVVVLGKLFNDFDLVVKYNDDVVAAAETGESSVALEISDEAEQQVHVYNQNAGGYGLNAACLMPSR